MFPNFATERLRYARDTLMHMRALDISVTCVDDILFESDFRKGKTLARYGIELLLEKCLFS